MAQATKNPDGTYAEVGHSEGPHIPTIQWEQIWGPISNTVVTTFVFLLLIALFAFFAKKALKSTKKSRLKLGVLSFVKFFDNFLSEGFGNDKKAAREFFPLIVGFFVIILWGNLFGLVVDWIGTSITPTLFYVMRPMHSDVNTTLVLSIITLYTLLFVSVRSHWAGNTLKAYFFNYTGKSVPEKMINVAVGWLHFIGLPATVISLSLRLFWNIFAWVVLLWVVTFLLASSTTAIFEIGRLGTIPFWFFELFVSLIQAIVFTGLMIAYFKQASEHH